MMATPATSVPTPWPTAASTASVEACAPRSAGEGLGGDARGDRRGHRLQLALLRTPGFMKIVHTSVVVVALAGAGLLAWWWQNRATVQGATMPTADGGANNRGAGSGPAGA